MFNSDQEDILMELGSLIREIHFSAIPDVSLLEALADQEKSTKRKKREPSDEIIFHFPLDTVADIYAYENSFSNDHIHSANFETDLFMEWQALYSFPNLRTLVLTCNNKEANYVEQDDLDELQLVLLNLPHLRLIIFDLSGMRSQIIDEVKSMIIFPFDNKKVEFKSMGKSRRNPGKARHK